MNGLYACALCTHVGDTVKFFDPYTGLSCDLNINERLGFYNTQLLREYCRLSPQLRSVVIALKRWAKPLGFNDSAGSKGLRSFSSYALTIMTIGLWQVCTCYCDLSERFANCDL